MYFVVDRLVPEPRLIARLLLTAVAVVAYEALFCLYTRATPGKLATSLRVAPIDRYEIDPGAAIRRGIAVAYPTVAVLTLPAAVGSMSSSIGSLVVGGFAVAVVAGAFLSVATAPARRGLPDRVADTIVVPYEAPQVISRDSVDGLAGGTAAPFLTAWGPVASREARRQGRAGRLDDSPALVVLLVAVLFAWTLDRPAVAIALACLWAAALVIDEARKIARDGGTAGHRAAGEAVLDEATGEPPTFGAALARSEVLAVFWLFPPLVPVLVIWIRLSPKRRGPHDLVAGTIVIDTTGGR